MFSDLIFLEEEKYSKNNHSRAGRGESGGFLLRRARCTVVLLGQLSRAVALAHGRGEL